MQMIQLLKVDDPKSYLDEILVVYTLLFKKSVETNDLRNFAISSLMTKQISQAIDMLERYGGKYYCYSCPPFVYRVEENDTLETIMKIRDCYIYNPASAF